MGGPGRSLIATVSPAESIEKLDGKPIGIQTHNFATPLDLALVLGKRARHDNILPHEKLGLALDIGSSGTEVFDAALKKLPVGGKIGVFRTLGSGMPSRLLILGAPEAPFDDFGTMPYSGIAWFGCFPRHDISHKHGSIE
jgi:hypothetical protein